MEGGFHRVVRSQSPEADELCGIKKSERSQRSKEGTFIAPFPLGGRASGYYAGELAEYPAAYATGATEDDIRALVRRQIERRKAHFERLRAA